MLMKCDFQKKILNVLFAFVGTDKMKVCLHNFEVYDYLIDCIIRNYIIFYIISVTDYRFWLCISHFVLKYII